MRLQLWLDMNKMQPWNNGGKIWKWANKHLRIVACAKSYLAMAALITFFEKGYGSRDAIASTLIANNNSCAEMRSDGGDAAIRAIINCRI